MGGPQHQEGALHALGNGRFVVYAAGADIAHVFGPPYTSASSLSGSWHLPDGGALRFASTRERGAAIWTHEWQHAGRVVGTSEAFVLPHMPIYLSRIQLDEPCTFGLNLPESHLALAGQEIPPNTALLWVQVPDTARFLFYPVGVPSLTAVVGWGAAGVEVVQQDDTWSLRFPRGESFFAIVGGPDYPDADSHLNRLFALPFAEARHTARAVGQRLSARLQLPSPQRDVPPDLVTEIHARAEDVAFLITAQQAEDGGILAGYPYPLAYSRDQYGVFRGLLALGLTEEARRNCEFRWHKWERFGNVRNAESMGHHRIRHLHENDDVEVTAYTILQTLEYVETTREESFLRQVFPMLDWCWRAQIKHLRGGMLPFNGDETYVAGGIMPRSLLNDGSMEATLLFLEAGQRLIPLVRQRGWWETDNADDQQRWWSEVNRTFRANFIQAEQLVANAPRRSQMPGMPLFRHGVCEGCGRFDWLKRSDTGRYRCCACEGRALPAVEATPQTIYAAALLPAFIHTRVLAPIDYLPSAQAALEAFQAQGDFPLTPGKNHTVGYDMGLLLYAALALHHPDADKIARLVLARADSTGAWSEYYQAEQHMGTRCRPWESGINIAVLLHYLR